MTEARHHFYEYLTCNNICCRVPGMTGRELIVMLLETLKRHTPSLDLAAAEREVNAREELFPTVIAPGLGLPHARLAGLESPLVALATSADGITFAGSDAPAHLVILLLSPVDNPNLHLQICSALATDFADPGRVRELAALGTPAEVIAALTGAPAAIPKYLRAADFVRRPAVTLLETDTLERAISIFATGGADELVVLDREGDLRGVLAPRDLLGYSLPEHLRWLEDMSPMYAFQPFAETLKAASETRVAELMREEFVSVAADAPAIQLAKLFLVRQVPQLVIVDDRRQFLGVVTEKEFCARLFWE